MNLDTVYVVDRRSVVDQATKVVEQMVANLPEEIKALLADIVLAQREMEKGRSPLV